MTITEFKKCMIPLTEVYQQGFNDTQSKIYYELMKDYEIPIMEDTIKEVLRTYTKDQFPKPGIICSKYEEVANLPKHHDVMLSNGIIIPKNEAVLIGNEWIRKDEYKYNLMQLEQKGIIGKTNYQQSVEKGSVK
jgi:hypothetical protein